MAVTVQKIREPYDYDSSRNQSIGTPPPIIQCTQRRGSIVVSELPGTTPICPTNFQTCCKESLKVGKILEK